MNLAICLRRPYTVSSPVGCCRGPVAASKLGVGGRFTLMGGSCCPCPKATAAIKVAGNVGNRSRRPARSNEMPFRVRSMKVLSLLAAGGLVRLRPARMIALNNTRLFRRQDVSAALGIAAVVLLVACTRSGRPAAGARRDAAALDPEGQGSGAWSLAPPRVPDCSPDRANGAVKPGGVLKVHLEASPPHLNPLQDSLEVVDRVTR